MATDINSIDFGRDSYKAANYNDSRNALLRALAADDAEIEESSDTSAIDVVDAALPIPQKPTRAQTDEEGANSTMQALKLLGFTPGKELVEFIFKLTDEGSAVRIKMQSMSVAHNEDSISILIPSTIELHPPKLTEFTIRLNNIQYPVIYAGSVLKLGSIQMLSFVRTQ